MKWKKWFILSWIIIIAASIVLSIQIRKTIPPISFENGDVLSLPVSIGLLDPDDSIPYLSKKGVTIQELIKSSDLVVKVTATNKREMKYQSILTKAKVDMVYKGDLELLDKDIYIYEYANVGKIVGKISYISTHTYNIMNEGRQYYLILKFNKMPAGYEYSQKDARTYLLSNVYYSKFAVEDIQKMQCFPNNAQKEMTYKNIKNWDILPQTAEQLNDYYKTRSDFLLQLQSLNLLKEQ